MNQQPEDEGRVSIWSVPKDWQIWYMVIFNAQVLCLSGLISWHEVVTAPITNGPIDTLIAIGDSMAPMVILVVAESILLTDVSKMLFTMISEKYLKRRRAEGYAVGHAEGHALGHSEGHAEGHSEGHAEGLAEGHAEGLAEGHAEGYAEGHVEEWQRWAKWNEARMAAEAAGEEFTEPPPQLSKPNGRE